MEVLGINWGYLLVMFFNILILVAGSSYPFLFSSNFAIEIYQKLPVAFGS